MTEEQKKLLLKDLSARLPYGIKILHKGWNYEWDEELSTVERVVGIDENFIYTKVFDPHNGEEYRDDKWPIDTFDDKLFLRPMSSMTEEEMDRLFDILHVDKDGKDEDWIKINDVYGIKFFFPTGKWIENVAEAYDYLNSIHIDYRGLIPMGLAIEASEGMYNTKNNL